MFKTLSTAAFIGAFALASAGAAFAQGTGPDVPSAPTPDAAKGGAMSKSSMSKSTMSKGAMKSKKGGAMMKKKKM